MQKEHKKIITSKPPSIKNLLVNETLLNAELALNRATSDNIIKLCGDYLRLLSEYRDQLYQLRGIPEINLRETSLARELVEQARKTVRVALEITTEERNRIEILLESFTSISGYEAIETFNQLKYKGFDNWELLAGGVRLKNAADGERMTTQEAVDIASLLRRETYIAHKTTFLRK
jgi:hypothetical protein